MLVSIRKTFDEVLFFYKGLAYEMRLVLRGLFFSFSVAASGCGGEGGIVSPPQTAIPAASAGTAGPSATVPAAPAPSAPSAISATVAPIEMRAPRPTTMSADLTTIGMDPRSLPPMDKLEPKVLRSVMKLMARSLGVKCVDCHQEGDFAAPTSRKRVAAKMWDEFVVKLTLADGAPLFCDSCHQGRVQQLDRSDKKRLARWMDGNFVNGLNRKDGGEHGCETCHVGMDMTFLTKWRKTSLP
ncbi:MAG: hypothetical protein M3O36_01690 [Myxococcota bacterium]|nr:hypothetical protein [Myxococcota bacterium]